MKRLLLVLLFVQPALTFAQQTKFLNVPEHSNALMAPVFSQDFKDIFETPESWTAITIYVDELANAPQYDFSKLKYLELVKIEFTFKPDTSDAAKKVYIDSVNALMKNLRFFSKCPKLDKIVFQVGEQIYLTKEETKDDDYDEKARAWEFRQNLAKAWDAFGKDVSILLPGVKLYAYNWGW